MKALHDTVKMNRIKAKSSSQSCKDISGISGDNNDNESRGNLSLNDIPMVEIKRNTSVKSASVLSPEGNANRKKSLNLKGSVSQNNLTVNNNNNNGLLLKATGSRKSLLDRATNSIRSLNSARAGGSANSRPIRTRYNY